jgi:hypothetical protein
VILLFHTSLSLSYAHARSLSVSMPTNRYREEKYNNKVFYLREQLFFIHMNLHHGRHLTIYNPKLTFLKSSQYNGDTDIKMSRNIFHRFIGYYLALLYSNPLHLNNTENIHANRLFLLVSKTNYSSYVSKCILL